MEVCEEPSGGATINVHPDRKHATVSTTIERRALLPVTVVLGVFFGRAGARSFSSGSSVTFVGIDFSIPVVVIEPGRPAPEPIGQGIVGQISRHNLNRDPGKQPKLGSIEPPGPAQLKRKRVVSNGHAYSTVHIDPRSVERQMEVPADDTVASKLDRPGQLNFEPAPGPVRNVHDIG